MKWFEPTKQHINWQEICNNINYMVNQGYDHKVMIGTDSQDISDSTIVVVAICILSEMSELDRTFYYGKEKIDKFKNLYSRISYETQKSIDVANKLRQYTHSMQDNLNINIHLDVSSDKAKNKTSTYSNSLISLVKAYDYPHVEVKPNSWAASYVADKFTKNDR